ncbi:MAG: histone family protein [Methanomicrobiales archaeon]
MPVGESRGDFQQAAATGREEMKEDQDIMTEIPIAPVIRIMRKTGAERVGNEAGEALADLMEQYGHKIAKEAVKLASHAGRKTITAADIRMAADLLS